MALQFNSFSTNSIALAIRDNCLDGGTGQTLRIYPTTVPLPTTPINGNILVVANANSHIAQFANLTTAVSNGVISITGGNLSIATIGAGNISWFAIWNNSNTMTRGYGAITSDSITLAGGGGVLTLNTLTPTLGQTLTISSFNISIVRT